MTQKPLLCRDPDRGLPRTPAFSELEARFFQARPPSKQPAFPQQAQLGPPSIKHLRLGHRLQKHVVQGAKPVGLGQHLDLAVLRLG